MGKLITVGMANNTSLYNYMKPDGTNGDLYNSTKYWIGDSYNYIGPGCHAVPTDNTWDRYCISYSWTVVNLLAGGLGDPNSDYKLLIAPYLSGYRMGKNQNYTGNPDTGGSILAGVIGNYGYFPVFLKGAGNGWGRQSIGFYSLNSSHKIYLGSINMIYLPALNGEIYNAKNCNNNGSTSNGPLIGCHKCFFDHVMCVPLSYYELGEEKQDVYTFSNSACTIHSPQYNDAWFYIVYYHGYIKNVTDNKVFYFKDFMIVNSYQNNFTPRTFGKTQHGYINDSYGSENWLDGGGPPAEDIDRFVASLCGKTIEFSVTLDLAHQRDTDERSGMYGFVQQSIFTMQLTMPDVLNSNNAVSFNYSSPVGGVGTRMMYFNWNFIGYKELSCDITLYLENDYYTVPGGQATGYGNMTTSANVTTSTGSVTLTVSGFDYLGSYNFKIKTITYRYIGGSGSLGFVAGTYNLNSSWYVSGSPNNYSNHPRTHIHTNNGRNIYLEVQCHG